MNLIILIYWYPQSSLAQGMQGNDISLISEYEWGNTYIYNRKEKTEGKL